MSEELRSLGINVRTVGFNDGFDIRLPRKIVDLREIVNLLPKGHEPDAIIVYDESVAWLYTGITELGIPTLFYAIDVHHHQAFQQYLGRESEWFVVAQPDYMKPMLEEAGAISHWMPLWASRVPEIRGARENKAIFIGNMNSTLNKDRVQFFEALGKKVKGFEARRGEWPEAFTSSQIVINQTVKGDVNFRIFEAMASGALCLTEACGNGLTELFHNHVHLELYERGNVTDAAEKIEYFLSHPALARERADAGYEEVLEKHLPIHRAEELLKILSRPVQKRHTPNLSSMLNFSYLSFTAERTDHQEVKCGSLKEGFRYLKQGIVNGEKFDSNLATHALLVASRHDMALGGEEGRGVCALIAQIEPRLEEYAHTYMHNQTVKGGFT